MFTDNVRLYEGTCMFNMCVQNHCTYKTLVFKWSGFTYLVQCTPKTYPVHLMGCRLNTVVCWLVTTALYIWLTEICFLNVRFCFGSSQFLQIWTLTRIQTLLATRRRMRWAGKSQSPEKVRNNVIKRKKDTTLNIYQYTINANHYTVICIWKP